jgi:ferredoxin
MLYIDPQTCIDRGACADACPVEAIYAEDELPGGLERFTGINAVSNAIASTRGHFDDRASKRPGTARVAPGTSCRRHTRLSG